MMKIYVFGFLIGMSALFAVPAHATETPSVVISEVAWAGSAKSTADEWFELANLSQTAVDISGWTVTGAASSSAVLTIPAETILEQGQTYLIANYDVGNEKTTLTIHPNIVTTSVSLSNSGLAISLMNASGIVVDQLVDASTPDFGSSTTFASMEREVTTLDWQTASLSINLLDGQQGTPGVTISLPVIEPAEPIDETVEENLPDDEVISVSEEPVVEAPATEPEVVTEPIPEVTAEEPAAAETPVTVVEEEVVVTPAVIEAPTEGTNTTTTDSSSSSNETDTNSSSSSSGSSTSQETVTQAATLHSYIAYTLLINEFVSDPEDGVEWIEIYNPGLVTVDLTGWSIRDAAGKATTFTQTEIKPNTYVVMDSPEGQLNNDGDTIELIDPSGTVIDAVTYGDTSGSTPDKGESAARQADGTWIIVTIITKGTVNTQLSSTTYADPENTTSTESGESTTTPVSTTDTTEGLPTGTDNNEDAGSQSTTTGGTDATPTSVSAPLKTPAASPTKIGKAKGTNKAPAVQTINLSELGSIADDTKIVTEGVIVALPGTFGRQIAYVSGAELYFYHADWPALAIGDVVKITGVVSSANGHKRIKLASINDLVVLGNETPSTTALTQENSNDLAHGTLVSLSGSVVGIQGNGLLVKVGETTVLLKAAADSGLTLSKFGPGTVNVMGILDTSGVSLSVLLRTTDDLTHQKPVAPAAGTTDGSHPSLYAWLGGGLFAMTLGSLGYWYAKNKVKMVSAINLKPLPL